MKQISDLRAAATDWPAIFKKVSQWRECPASASLEERAACAVRNSPIHFDIQNGFAVEMADTILDNLRAVAPPSNNSDSPSSAEFKRLREWLKDPKRRHPHYTFTSSFCRHAAQAVWEVLQSEGSIQNG